MDFARLLRPLHNRIANLIGRGSVRSVDDSQPLQTLSVDLGDDETRTELERVQPYGFTSVPQKDAGAVVLFVNGSRDHGLVLAVDDRRYRLTGLADGEVALYTDQGDSITIKRGGTVVVHARAVELAGADQAVALAQRCLDELNKLKSAYDAHTHAFGALVCTGGTVTGSTAAGPTAPALAAPGSSKVKAGL